MRDYEIPLQRASTMAKNSLQREEEYEYDEYDVEASEQEEDAHEAPKPTMEEKQFLKLREQLKNRIRENMKKQSARAFGSSSQSQDKRRTTTGNTFGSFFGPSQTVIASRVIEESRSIRDNKRVVESSSKSSVDKGNSIISGARAHINHQQPQRGNVMNETKRKAQTLKDMRDYSFLFSDDADMSHAKDQLVSVPRKQQPTSRSSVSAPKPYTQSSQVPLKRQLPANKPIRLPSSGNGVKNPVASKQNMQTKGGSVKVATPHRPPPTPVAPRRISVATVANQSSKTAGNRTTLPKAPSQSTDVNMPAKKVVGNSSMQKHSSSVRHPIPSVQKHYSSMKYPSHSVQKHSSPVKYPNPTVQKHSSSVKHPYPSVQKNYPVQNKSMEEQKIMMKRQAPSSKVQNMSHGIQKECLKKRPARRDLSDEEVDYRSLIRGMFRYNPNKYSGMDEDDSDMEVGFDVIQKEERRSAKIAREEDEEQLRLIEEEEQERQRRMKKKLKRV